MVILSFAVYFSNQVGDSSGLLLEFFPYPSRISWKWNKCEQVFEVGWTLSCLLSFIIYSVIAFFELTHIFIFLLYSTVFYFVQISEARNLREGIKKGFTTLRKRFIFCLFLKELEKVFEKKRQICIFGFDSCTKLRSFFRFTGAN